MRILLIALSISAMAFSVGACSDVSHSESTKTNWDGSTTHQETTVKQAPDGAVTVDKESMRTR